MTYLNKNKEFIMKLYLLVIKKSVFKYLDCNKPIKNIQ